LNLKSPARGTNLLKADRMNYVLIKANVCENPTMTFTIKKSINMELFIDRMAALYIVDGWIRVGTNEDDQHIDISRL